MRVTALERPIEKRLPRLLEPGQMRETSDLEIRKPSDSNTRSIFRVETPGHAPPARLPPTPFAPPAPVEERLEEAAAVRPICLARGR